MALPGGLANVKLKQLIWPVLWCIIVFLFLLNKPNSWSPSQSSEQPTDQGNSSRLSTITEALTNKVTSYFADYTPPVANVSSNARFVTANVSTSIKAAVIVETRNSAALIPLILHFSAVLGPDWPVIVYTTAENFGSFSTSHALARHQKAGRIVVRALANGVYFPSWDSVSQFLTQKWLWEDLAPAEHILVFQNDAMLCANSARSVEDFFEWDWIGAPITADRGHGYNGGLSLRKRSTTLRVLENYDWETSTGVRAEDQWYYNRLRELQKKELDKGITDGIKLPSMELARTFSVETIDYPSPLGLHQPTRYLQSHMMELDDWCPEWKLARTDRNF